MKIEMQVCSLDLSKKLKELGVKQESYFFWWKEGKEYFIWNPTDQSDYETGSQIPICSAFTVAELGEMLPSEIKLRLKLEKKCKPISNDFHKKSIVAHLNMRIIDGLNNICYEFGDAESVDCLPNHWIAFDSKTEADARAKMLIYLIEKNLIEVRG